MTSPTPPTAAMRRQILSLLSESETLTLAAATSRVAAEQSTRLRHCGFSPPSERTSAALVLHVGADVSADLAAAERPGLNTAPRRR